MAISLGSAVTGNLEFMTAVMAVGAVLSAAKKYTEVMFNLVSSYPKGLSGGVMGLAVYFSYNMYAVALDPAVQLHVLYRVSFTFAFITMIYGPFLVLTPTNPMVVTKKTLVKKVLRAVGKKKVPWARIIVLVLLVGMQGWVVYAIVSFLPMLMVGKSEGEKLQLIIGIAVGYSLVTLFYLVAYYAVVLGKELRVKGKNMMDIIRKNIKIKRKNKPPLEVLNHKHYGKVYLLAWLAASGASISLVVQMFIMDMVLWDDLTVGSRAVSIIAFIINVTTVLLLSGFILKIARHPVDCISEVKMDDGTILAVDKVKYVSIARSADRLPLLNYARPHDPHTSMIQETMTHLIHTANSVPGYHHTTLHDAWAGAVHQSNDQRCMFFAACGASYEQDVAFHFLNAVQGHVADQYYDYKGFDLFAPNEWTHPLFDYIDDVSDRYCDKDQLIDITKTAKAWAAKFHSWRQEDTTLLESIKQAYTDAGKALNKAYVDLRKYDEDERAFFKKPPPVVAPATLEPPPIEPATAPSPDEPIAPGTSTPQVIPPDPVAPSDPPVLPGPSPSPPVPPVAVDNPVQADEPPPPKMEAVDEDDGKGKGKGKGKDVPDAIPLDPLAQSSEIPLSALHYLEPDEDEVKEDEEFAHLLGPKGEAAVPATQSLAGPAPDESGEALLLRVERLEKTAGMWSGPTRLSADRDRLGEGLRVADDGLSVAVAGSGFTAEGPARVMPMAQEKMLAEVNAGSLTLDATTRVADYSGGGANDGDVSCIVTENPVPETEAFFYAEVTVLSKGRDCAIGVGLLPAGAPREGMPGWRHGSFGYHGDDGCLFSSDLNGRGNPYGPTWDDGDVIGLRWNKKSGAVNYVKNGMPLKEAYNVGGAFHFVVGFHSPGAKASVNFGAEPFKYAHWMTMLPSGEKLQTGLPDLVKIEEDGLTVKYLGPGETNDDAGLVRSHFPINENLANFYYEITIKDPGEDASIAIGLWPSDTTQSGMPGWRFGSYGFHGDDGFTYEHTANGNGNEYGPVWKVNDVIGCNWNTKSGDVFYTHNGKPLPVVFKHVLGFTGTKYFPMVGLHTPGACVTVNFGATPFKYRTWACAIADAPIIAGAYIFEAVAEAVVEEKPEEEDDDDDKDKDKKEKGKEKEKKDKKDKKDKDKEAGDSIKGGMAKKAVEAAPASGILRVGWSGTSTIQDLGISSSSWAYDGISGDRMYEGENSPYGPTFGVGDVISAFIDHETGHLTFAKNGTWLGPAMRFTPGTPMYPTIAMCAPDIIVRVSFSSAVTAGVATPLLLMEPGSFGQPRANPFFRLAQKLAGGEIDDAVEEYAELEKKFIDLVDADTLGPFMAVDKDVLQPGVAVVLNALQRLQSVAKLQLHSSDPLAPWQQVAVDRILRAGLVDLRVLLSRHNLSPLVPAAVRDPCLDDIVAPEDPGRMPNACPYKLLVAALTAFRWVRCSNYLHAMTHLRRAVDALPVSGFHDSTATNRFRDALKDFLKGVLVLLESETTVTLKKEKIKKRKKEKKKEK